MNVASWGGGIGCWDSFACLFLSLPRRLVSARSVRRHWQERVFPWQKCNLLYSHTHKKKKEKKSTQCPFSSNAGNEHKAISSLRHQACLPASAMPGPWPPARRAAGWARALAPSAAWAPRAATCQCPGLVFALCLRGNGWSQTVQIQIAQALPSISLYLGQWLLVSVSLKCRAIKLLLYLARMQFFDVS